MSAEPARDSGLFGPSSVTWRIMSEPVMWVAGLRALYLQALNPRVMKGTWQNSSFADSAGPCDCRSRRGCRRCSRRCAWWCRR